MDLSESKKITEASAQSFTLKISLLFCEEDCYRVVKVPASIKLNVFHDQVLVPAMGWARAYHGYVFQDATDGSAIGPAGVGMAYIDMMHAPMHYHYVMDDKEIPLASLVQKPGDHCYYTYDLGDNFAHRIEVIDSVNSSSSKVELVEDFLADYKKNPNASAVKEAIREIETCSINYTKPWMGPPIKCKPLEFDLDRHRLMLGMMLQGPTIPN